MPKCWQWLSQGDGIMGMSGIIFLLPFCICQNFPNQHLLLLVNRKDNGWHVKEKDLWIWNRQLPGEVPLAQHLLADSSVSEAQFLFCKMGLNTTQFTGLLWGSKIMYVLMKCLVPMLQPCIPSLNTKKVKFHEACWNPWMGVLSRWNYNKNVPRQFQIAAILPFSRICKECLCAHGGATSSFWGCQLIFPNPRIFLSSDSSLHSPPLTSVHCLTNQGRKHSLELKLRHHQESWQLWHVYCHRECMVLADHRTCQAGLPRRGLNEAAEDGCKPHSQAASPAFGQSSCPSVSLAVCFLPLGTSAWLLVELTSFTEPAWFMGEETPSHRTYGT